MTRPTLAVLFAIVFAIPCFPASRADFEAPQLIALGVQTVGGVVAGDFNGDGKLDLAVSSCCPSQAELSILFGRGDRTFKAPVTYSLLSSPIVLAVGDFNHDGSSDIAVGEGSELEILLNAGNGTFYSAAAYQFYDVTSIAVGDFNGDHNLDLALTGLDSNLVTVFSGKGDGTFLPAVNYPAGDGAHGVAVGDFNNDGKLDLVVSNGYFQGQDQNQFNLLLGNGDGTFQAPVGFATDQIPNAIAAADFNGDGKMDVAVLCSWSTIPFSPDTDVVDIFLGYGDGTFQNKTSYHVDFTAAGLLVTDLNHDGAPDIAVLNAYVGDVTVLLNQRDGTFVRPKNYQSYFPSSSVGITCITAGDFSGQGSIDLVTAAGEDIALLRNKGYGHFQTAPDYSSGAGTIDMKVGDFDGDGVLDIVTLNTAASGFPSRLIVLPGNPAIVGYHHVQTELSGPVRGLVVGDLNNDGKLDAVVDDSTTNGEQAGVTVLLGNGDGTFTQAHTYSLVNGCWAGPMVLGDLNGDGYLDLVVANSGCQSLSIFLGTGDGGFRFLRSIATGGTNGGQYQQGLALVDLNIAVSNGRIGFAGIIGIRMGRGDGTFEPVQAIDDGFHNPYAVVAADFNGDGNQDLAITNYDNSQVMILLGRGDGQFMDPMYTSLSQPSTVLLAGDFNGDGKVDLAALPQLEYVGKEVAVLHGNGDGTFESEQDYPTGINPIALVSGNFQGASHGLDLAVLLGWVVDPKGMAVTVYERPPGQ